MYILEICHGICIFEVRTVWSICLDCAYTAIDLKGTINSGFYLSVVMEERKSFNNLSYLIREIPCYFSVCLFYIMHLTYDIRAYV